MLIARGLIAAICVAAIPFAIVEWLSQDSLSHAPQIETEQHSDSAAKRRDNGNQQVSPSNQVLTIRQQNASIDPQRIDDEEAEKRRREDSEFWTIFGHRVKITDTLLAIFTFFLVIVGIGQGIFLYRTDQGTHKTAVAAKEAAEHIPRVERAYLFLWHEIDRRITPNAIPNTGDILEVNFRFHNHGKTPAILRRIEADIRVVERNEFPTALRDVGATDMPPGLIISGGQATPTFPQRTLMSAERWREVTFQGHLLLFLGRVQYLDIFGDLHETGFCLQWFGDGFGPAATEALNYYT
jgi:hypothetical protein